MGSATAPARRASRRIVPLTLWALVLTLLLAGAGLYFHARGATNQVALAAQPKGVTTIIARAAHYQPTRRYVGTVEPWVQARIGPQLVSAYVQTVMVRPGSHVRRGDVIATLDCRHTGAGNRALAEKARALAASQAALAKQTARVQSLLNGGYASPDEVEMKTAENDAKQAQLSSLQAEYAGSTLQVSDCVLRAPFDGEIGERFVDPGAFIKPGEAVATLVDRHTLRVAAEVPETDFADVAPGTALQVRVLATGQTLSPVISRRAPSADPSTRTVHIEADVDDKEHDIPSGTTAEINLNVGAPAPATVLPLAAASIKGGKATTFVVAHGLAHRGSYPVLGEHGGDLYVDPLLPDGAAVVLEGRAALVDGDQVVASEQAWSAETTTTPVAASSRKVRTVQ